MDPRLEELLKNNSSLIVIPEKQRIRCIYTMHEMPYDFELVSHHISCPKYKRAYVKHLLEEHSDYIVDVSSSIEHRNQLFCKLTWRYINKDPDHLLRHLHGRRFQKALIRYNQCKETGGVFVPNTGKFKNSSYFKDRCANESVIGVSEALEDSPAQDGFVDLVEDEPPSKRLKEE
ncbi:unnamed protein product [Calicophoron daubneyi]|uniref:Uncharacterized protein n=1 Tax=Calicophoron daubneyi TaxID=300641 RepID=A0AAV2TGH0_CALDB